MISKHNLADRRCRRFAARAMALGTALALSSAPALGEPAGARLDLDAAEQAALTAQPLLARQAAMVRAAEERAVAAAQLPDPQLQFGFSELPVNTGDRFRFDRDGDTDLMIGLMQEFPRAEKRRLRGEQERLGAATGRAELEALERQVRRETALAYLDVWLPERSIELVRAMIAEAERERAAAEIAVRSGRTPQADLLAAEVELELLHDRTRQLAQQTAAARARLERWTGEPLGSQVTTAQAPDLPLPTDPPELESHPEVAAQRRNVALAETGLRLAEQSYRPDWRLDVRYGWRPGPGFSEMLTVMVGVDLPLFRRNRQDREVAAARESLASVEAGEADLLRRLRAEAAAAYAAWTVAAERLDHYDAEILPKAQARAEAALAAYRADQTELAAVLSARRAVLDVHLMRLELEAEVLRWQADLRYLST